MSTLLKTRKHPFLSRSLAICAGLTLSFSVLEASVIFSFGPSDSMLTAAAPFERTATMTGSGPYVSTSEFSDTSPLSPASGYNGPTFYGGYTFSSSSYAVGFAPTSTAQGQGLANNFANTGNQDAIYFNVTAPASDAFYTSNLSFASVILFKQDAYNTDFRSGPIKIEGFSVSLFKTSGSSTITSFTPAGRLVVQIGSVYYISEEVFSKTAVSLETFQLAGDAFQALTWTSYSPEEGIFCDPDAQYTSLALENVTAVGLYIEDRTFRNTDGTIGMRLAISDFSVTGTAIPEARTTAYLGLGLFAFFGHLARKRMRMKKL